MCGSVVIVGDRRPSHVDVRVEMMQIFFYAFKLVVAFFFSWSLPFIQVSTGAAFPELLELRNTLLAFFHIVFRYELGVNRM